MISGRIYLLTLLIFSSLALGFPAAFLGTHGFDPQGWPALTGTASTWFSAPGRDLIGIVSGGLLRVVGTYLRMALGFSPAFPGGGRTEIFAIVGATLLVGMVIVLGAQLETLRHWTTQFGDAQFASQRLLKRMRTGIEIGLNPATRRAVRVNIEGNLLTIAPPRRGKTTGLVLPNLAVCDEQAWSGPAVVIDPKGDAYRAARRRRTDLGRKVRCLDPLGLVGGTDRWNPLLRRMAGDVLYLQTMAQALLPATDVTSESGAFFRDRAVIILVAAMLVSIQEGRNDVVRAAALVRDPDQLLKSLEARDDALACDARSILTGEERTRSNILSTANYGLSWLLDASMQEAVCNNTFAITDLCDGDTDLFIVLPADDRRATIAPYVRWLLADLFAAVREKRVIERIVLFLDEAFVLGKFNAILNGAGELPGYGLSLWTFWQSESQLSETYGSAGATILRDTAEVVQLFNLSRANPDECKRWSEALGTYTGIDKTETREATAASPSRSTSATAVPLVHPAALAEATQHHSLVFMNGPAYTTDPLKLSKTSAHRDWRCADLLDFVTPVGATSGRKL